MVTFLTTCICLGIIIFILFYFYLTRNFNYWKNQNVPCFKPIPIFGNVFSVVVQRTSINGYLNFLYKSTGLPYIGFFIIFDQPSVLIRDPALLKRILVSDFNYFQDRSIMYNEYDKYTINMMIMVKQPKWKILRTNIAPAFSSGTLKHMVPLILEVGDDMVNYIKAACLNAESSNCRNISINYAIDAISTCAFGIRTNSHQSPEFAIVSKKVLGTTPLRSIQMAAHYFAPSLVKIFHMTFSDQDSCRYLEKVLLKSMRERENLNTSRRDFMDFMKEIQIKDSLFFSNDVLVGIFLHYLLAGFETTGATIAFTLYELYLNPTIQNRLRNEILTVLAKHETLTYEAIQEMTYLHMVIKETLRKFPPLPFLDRACNTTYTIPNTDIVIKEGMSVFISLTALHHDEKYFPNPMLFDPERFSPENKSSITPYTYMPFGEGYHNCLGIKFGILSASIGIIKILSNFEVITCKDTPTVLSFETSGFLLTPLSDKINLTFRSLNP